MYAIHQKPSYITDAYPDRVEELATAVLVQTYTSSHLAEAANENIRTLIAWEEIGQKECNLCVPGIVLIMENL